MSLPEASPEAWRALRALVGGGGPGVPGAAGRAPAGPTATGGIVVAARRAGVVRLAASRAEGPLAEALRPFAERGLGMALFYESAEAALAEALGDVPAALMKGGATGRLLFPEDPTLRQRNDVDVLVPDGAFEEVVSRLVRRGGTDVTAASLLWNGRPWQRTVRWPSGTLHVGIDVHRRLQRWSRPSIDPAEVLSRARPAAGSALAVLGPEDSLLVASVHAANEAFRAPLRGLLDAAGLAALPALDRSLVLDLARRWRARTIVWATLDLARRWLGTPFPEDLEAGLEPDRATAGVLRALLSGDGENGLGRGGRAASELFQVLARDGLGGRIGHAAAKVRGTGGAWASRARAAAGGWRQTP